MRNGNFLKMRVCEIRVKQIPVNQGLGVHSILPTAPTCTQQFVCYSSFLRHVCGAKHPGPGVNVAHISNMKNSKQIDLQ